MEVRKLICINCPMGCPMEVTMENGEVKSVTGNTCPRGDAYARKEVTDPRRIVCSTVPCEGGDHLTLPVKTATDIPKGKIFDVVAALKDVKVAAPVKVGDVVLANVAGTGVDIVAARTVEKA